MKSNDGLEGRPERLQRDRCLLPLAVNQLDHLAESVFTNGEQEFVLAFVIPVHGHGRTANLRANAAHGNALIPLAGKQVARGIPDHLAQSSAMQRGLSGPGPDLAPALGGDGHSVYSVNTSARKSKD